VGDYKNEGPVTTAVDPQPQTGAQPRVYSSAALIFHFKHYRKANDRFTETLSNIETARTRHKLRLRTLLLEIIAENGKGKQTRGYYGTMTMKQNINMCA